MHSSHSLRRLDTKIASNLLKNVPHKLGRGDKIRTRTSEVEVSSFEGDHFGTDRLRIEAYV